MNYKKSAEKHLESTGSYVWKNKSGWCVLSWTSRGITALSFGLNTKNTALQMANNIVITGRTAPSFISETIEELNRYFEGEKVKFTAAIDYGSATAFQKAVWKAACKIPYGKTRSYGEVAASAGSPRGARAAGTALGANRVPIIIPCHRVLHGNGEIGGYALGTDVKKALLLIENPQHKD